ncbi:MAG: DUF2752 domain-containing protein [Pirellulales bacterium]
MSSGLLSSDQTSDDAVVPANMPRQNQGSSKLSRWERIVMGTVATTLMLLLGLAAWLSPSTEGMGTHQQLGLPPCTLVLLLGMRCPGCGMTTSWAYMLDGRWVDSFSANAGGALLCLLAIWSTPITWYYAIRGSGSRKGWFSRYCAIALLICLLVATVEWFGRLFL